MYKKLVKKQNLKFEKLYEDLKKSLGLLGGGAIDKVFSNKRVLKSSWPNQDANKKKCVDFGE